MTDHQVNRYKELRRQFRQEAAAAKVGRQRSQRASYRADDDSCRRSVGRGQWRTRADPLAGVWEAELVPLLRQTPALTAVTLLEELQRRHPGRFDARVLRTLQRRVRRWRALEGEEREVFFAQEHTPGRLGLSDFTDAAELGVRIAGVPLAHRLYQFALAYSGWRHVEVVLGGESFVALSSGLQNALWRLGGAPAEHRTDSLSAAFATWPKREDLTRRYESAVRALRHARHAQQPGREPRERRRSRRGSGTLKHFLEQALLLRGTRVRRLEDYRRFVAEVVERANARLVKALAVERACLRRAAGATRRRLRRGRRAGEQVRAVHGAQGVPTRCPRG